MQHLALSNNGLKFNNHQVLITSLTMMVVEMMMMGALKEQVLSLSLLSSFYCDGLCLSHELYVYQHQVAGLNLLAFPYLDTHTNTRIYTRDYSEQVLVCACYPIETTFSIRDESNFFPQCFQILVLVLPFTRGDMVFYLLVNTKMHFTLYSKACAHKCWPVLYVYYDAQGPYGQHPHIL